MIILEHLKLSIEKSHGPNDGHAKGSGEKQFIEHLYLLVFELGLGKISKICSFSTSLAGVKPYHLGQSANTSFATAVLIEKAPLGWWTRWRHIKPISGDDLTSGISLFKIAE